MIRDSINDLIDVMIDSLEKMIEKESREKIVIILVKTIMDLKDIKDISISWTEKIKVLNDLIAEQTNEIKEINETQQQNQIEK